MYFLGECREGTKPLIPVLGLQEPEKKYQGGMSTVSVFKNKVSRPSSLLEGIWLSNKPPSLS